jgi:Zn-dependent protease with chaperone function
VDPRECRLGFALTALGALGGAFTVRLIDPQFLGVLIPWLLGAIVVCWFSRQREFRADAGGAQLAGREKMIAALSRLKAAYEPSTLPQQVEAFGISGKEVGGLQRLFMSHPPLDERIATLRAGSESSGLSLAR